MPSHTFFWVGRYEDAALANIQAVQVGIEEADAVGATKPTGLWGSPYQVHNITFGIGGAMMANDAGAAMKLAEPLVEAAPSQDKGSRYQQIVSSLAYFAYGRYADPKIVLRLAEPKLPLLKGAWHYMRGEAFAREKNAQAVLAEASAIPKQEGKLSADDLSLHASMLLEIERSVLEGRAAELQGDYSKALDAFEAAAILQESKDFSNISDPPAFWYPVRRSVAEAKYKLGDIAGAREDIRRSLQFRPKDPVALRFEAALRQLP